MVSKETLLTVLPVRDQVVLTKEDRQNTDDIRQELLLAHRDFAPDYDLIYSYFDKGDIIETSREIFDFLKINVPYKKENGNYQTIKNPRAILTFNDGSTNLNRVDCKNYASFIGGIIDRIKRHNGGDWDWCYRFASYDERDPEPGHVFVVVETPEGELWVDPVFSYFNDGTMHEWELDQKPAKSIGGLYRVICGPTDNGSLITVDAVKARANFLTAVTLNLFGLKDLLLNNPQVTNGPVAAELESLGVNLLSLSNILKNG
jgi:hypothetical protein